MALPVRSSSNPIQRLDPAFYLDDMHQRMNQWMHSVFPQYDTGTATWTPLADVSESDNAYEMDIDVPGVRREDISIELNGQELSISGEFTQREPEGQTRHATRRSGRFEYEVRLPHTVDSDNISAELNNGVLHVMVPKAKDEQPKRIEIKS